MKTAPFCALMAIAIAAALPAPLAAQSPGEASSVSGKATAPAMVSAANPAGVLSALQAAGYEDAERVPKDETGGDTVIRLENEGLASYIYFKDCDEAVPDFCETLVLSTSWDRDTPMSADAVAQANLDYRYISVWRDEEGDPYAQWAILTGREGIPAPLFLDALNRYLGVVYDFWGVVFDGDGDGEGDGDGDRDGESGEGETEDDKATPEAEPQSAGPPEDDAQSPASEPQG